MRESSNELKFDRKEIFLLFLLDGLERGDGVEAAGREDASNTGGWYLHAADDHTETVEQRHRQAHHRLLLHTHVPTARPKIVCFRHKMCSRK